MNERRTSNVQHRTLNKETKQQLYDLEEPFPECRPANDREYVIDHFFVKLLWLADQMQTETGRQEAVRRTAFMQAFLAQLGNEIGSGS